MWQCHLLKNHLFIFLLYKVKQCSFVLEGQPSLRKMCYFAECFWKCAPYFTENALSFKKTQCIFCEIWGTFSRMHGNFASSPGTYSKVLCNRCYKNALVLKHSNFVITHPFQLQLQMNIMYCMLRSKVGLIKKVK